MTNEKPKRRVALVFAAVIAVLLLALYWTRKDAPPEVANRGAPAALPVGESVSRTLAPTSEVMPTVDAPAKAATVAAAAPQLAAREPIEAAAAPDTVPKATPMAAVEPAKLMGKDEEPQTRFELRFKETLGGLIATMIEVQIDGVTVATKESPKGIGANLAWPLSESQVKLGVRQVDVIVKLVGDSDAFPYLAGYTFTMKKSAAIPIRGPTVMRLDATTKGNVTDDWTKRVNLEFHVEQAAAAKPPT